MLLTHKDKVNSIIFCQRISTTNIFKSLIKAKILVFDNKKKIFRTETAKIRLFPNSTNPPVQKMGIKTYVDCMDQK